MQLDPELNEPSAEFAALFFLVDDCIQELQVWDHQLEPMDHRKRPIKEWVAEAIYESVGSLRDLIPNIPKEGDFQVLVRKGKISGWWSGWEYPEWNEEVEFLDVEFAPIPDQYLQDRFGCEPLKLNEPPATNPDL